MKLETQAIHAGHQIDPASSAVMPPIYLSTTFERQPDGSYPHGYDYTRSDNPTRKGLEDLRRDGVVLLEGGRSLAAGQVIREK